MIHISDVLSVQAVTVSNKPLLSIHMDTDEYFVLMKLLKDMQDAG